MKILKRPRGKQIAITKQATFDGLRARIQGAPLGSKSAPLAKRIAKAKGSLTAQELKELERLLAGRIANGELT